MCSGDLPAARSNEPRRLLPLNRDHTLQTLGEALHEAHETGPERLRIELAEHTAERVMRLGMPCFRPRNCPRKGRLARPNTSMSEQSSPPHSMVHKAMIRTLAEVVTDVLLSRVRHRREAYAMNSSMQAPGLYPRGWNPLSHRVASPNPGEENRHMRFPCRRKQGVIQPVARPEAQPRPMRYDPLIPAIGFVLLAGTIWRYASGLDFSDRIQRIGRSFRGLPVHRFGRHPIIPTLLVAAWSGCIHQRA